MGVQSKLTVTVAEAEGRGAQLEEGGILGLTGWVGTGQRIVGMDSPLGEGWGARGQAGNAPSAIKTTGYCFRDATKRQQGQGEEGRRKGEREDTPSEMQSESGKRIREEG